MAHFYGSIDGNRGEASRLGSKHSGFRAVAASYQGSVRAYLSHDEATGRDMVRVELDDWRGSGVRKPVLLYEGPIGEYAPTTHTLAELMVEPA